MPQASWSGYRLAMQREIRVSAVVLRDADGAVLFVRKRGTTMWMNPGGKPEPGEDAAACAAREVAEELGLLLDPAELIPLGEHVARAANEPDHLVVADVFAWPCPVEPAVEPAAEIDAVRWVGRQEFQEPGLAPLFTDHIAALLDRLE